MDERRFQKARIAAIPRPRVVAIGSSRVMQLSTPGLGLRPGEFYNAGIPAPTVEDYIAVWWWLKRYGKIPDVAVFSVDVWAFHRYQSQVHVAVVADEVTRFLEGAGVGRGVFWRPAQEVVYWWYRAKEFFSYTVLRRSLRDLERMRIGRAPRGADVFQIFVPEAEMAGRSARRADGSMVNDGPSPNEPPADVGPAAVRFVLPGTTDLGGFQWDAERAARLELLWRDMTAAGVKIVAYMPPYCAVRVGGGPPGPRILRDRDADRGLSPAGSPRSSAFSSRMPRTRRRFRVTRRSFWTCSTRRRCAWRGLLRPRISGLASALPGHRGFQVSAVGRHPALDDVEAAQDEPIHRWECPVCKTWACVRSIPSELGRRSIPADHGGMALEPCGSRAHQGGRARVVVERWAGHSGSRLCRPAPCSRRARWCNSPIPRCSCRPPGSPWSSGYAEGRSAGRLLWTGRLMGVGSRPANPLLSPPVRGV